MKTMMEKFNIWSLYYRQEIVWFVAGLIVGAILI
tara:strand:+ start:4403 stop:4504 length:102 start_codon:yes stop_codon:yes gene_type:complete